MSPITLTIFNGQLQLRCTLCTRTGLTVPPPDLLSSHEVYMIVCYLDNHSHGQSSKSPLEMYQQVLDEFTKASLRFAEASFSRILERRMLDAAGVNPYEDVTIEASFPNNRRKQ